MIQLKFSDKVVDLINKNKEASLKELKSPKSVDDSFQIITSTSKPLFQTTVLTSRNPLFENNTKSNLPITDTLYESKTFINPLFEVCTNDVDKLCIHKQRVTSGQQRTLLQEGNRLLRRQEQQTDIEFTVLKNYTFSPKRNKYSKLVSEKVDLVSNNQINQRKQSFSLLKRAAKKKLKKRLRKIAEERLNVKEIFSRYVKTSTLHGYAYACSDTFYIRRTLWTMLMFLGALYFLLKLRVGIIEYFQYPFSTLSTVDFPESLTFPAISICPINNFNKSIIENSKLKRLYDDNRLPLDKNWIDPGFDIPGNELAEILENSSLQIDKLHSYCDWISRNTSHPEIPVNPCGIENFTKYFNYKDQLCFTLNSGKEGHKLLSVDHEGITYGYELALDMHNNEIISSYPYTGVKLIIHNQWESPVMSDGFVISPGDKTFIKMEKVETKSLQPPYSTKCGNVKLKYHSVYNQKTCLLELMTEHLGKTCRCRALFMPDNGMRYCSLRETFACIFPAKESFNEYDMRERCPVECNSLSYKHEITYARFLHNPPIGVSVPLMEEAAKKKNMTPPVLRLKKTKRMTSKELGNYIRENIIYVIFFFGDIKKEIHEQEATLDFYQFLGDMGGEIGIMLGASLLTFVEFMDLLIFFVYHQLLRI